MQHGWFRWPSFLTSRELEQGGWERRNRKKIINKILEFTYKKKTFEEQQFNKKRKVLNTLSYTRILVTHLLLIFFKSRIFFPPLKSVFSLFKLNH